MTRHIFFQRNCTSFIFLFMCLVAFTCRYYIVLHQLSYNTLSTKFLLFLRIALSHFLVLEQKRFCPSFILMGLRNPLYSFFFSKLSFPGSAFQYENPIWKEEKRKKRTRELIRLWGNYEPEEKNVLLALAILSFSSLFVPSSVELLSKNSQKHEDDLTLIKTFCVLQKSNELKAI